MPNILKPLEPPFEANIDAVLSRYPSQNGYILSLFRIFANSLRFLTKAVPNLLDKESPLPLRIREIVILKTTAHRGCEYEWGVHVSVFAKAATLTQNEVRATLATGTQGWEGRESRLVAAIEQLCSSAQLDETSLTDFQSDWSLEEQLEILALVGTYTTISLVANVAQLEPEPFGARF